MASDFPGEQVPNENVGAPPPPPSPLPTPPGLPPAASNMIERIKRLLMSPKTEWPAIDAEPMTLNSILIMWVLPLAAIGPVAGVIRNLLFPITVPFTNITYRVPLVGSIVQAAIAIALTMLGVWLWSLVLDMLAPNFKGIKNPIAALKLVAFSATAAWLCGIFQITWATTPLAIIGLYSAYLFWVGVPVLMKVPDDQRPVYVVVAVIVGIIVNFVAAALAGALAGMLFVMSPGAGTAGTIGTTNGGSISIGGTTIDTGKLNAAAANIKAATDKMQADAANGTSSAVPSADLQAMLPASVGGFARGDVSSASGGAAGLNGSKAEATYTMGDKSFTLSVADIGAMGAIATLGGAVNAQSSKTTSTGYEKTEMVNGSMVSERWDNQGSSGAYSTVVGGRFAIEASGSAPGIDTLKQAVASIDAGKLAAMAK